MFIITAMKDLGLNRNVIPIRDKLKLYSKTNRLRQSLFAKIIKQSYIYIINVVFIIRRRFKQY